MDWTSVPPAFRGSISMNNFSMSYSFTYNYTVMPLKTGTFKIPPQAIEAGGKSLHTPELSLNVVSRFGAIVALRPE